MRITKPCKCGCGQLVTKAAANIKPSGNMFVDRNHYDSWQRGQVRGRWSTRVYHQEPHHRFTKAKARAARRNIPWTVEEPMFLKLIQMTCNYCGGRLGITGSALDRIENSKGYSEDNVVPCCRVCNVLKNDYFTYEEMMELSPVLKNIQQKRNQPTTDDGLRT